MRVSVPRIRSLTLKDGGCKITVIDTYAHRCYQASRDALCDLTEAVAADMPRLAGFAFVAWDATGNEAYSKIYNSDVSPIWRNEIPEFTKQRLVPCAISA
jgi:hypothetical protein